MRHLRTLIAGTAVAAAALSVVGLTATAQALPVRLTAGGGSDPSVPQGVATTVGLPTCPSGDKASVSSKPALPTTETAVIATNKSKLVGVWPASPAKYKVTITCAGGPTKHSTVTIESAPPENSAVGLGADTQEFLVDQFSGDYNGTVSSSATHLYNWDATNPVTGAIGDSITIKQNCASIARPDGSSPGIKQLATFATTSDGNYYCDNFANDARPRAATDPPYASGGVAFVAFAADAVDWSRPAVNTVAPASLTPAQLNEIWTCTVPQANNGTGANQWGDLNPALTGSAASTPIAPFDPESGAGTLTFWLGAIGVTTPGPCVSNDGNTLEQNEGDNPVLDNPGAIYFYSVGDWIAQRYHSPACTVAGCTSSPPCTPAPHKNEFGCDLIGTGTAQGAESLGEINGTKATTGKGGNTTINSGFDSTFDRTLYSVVPYDPNTTDHIPGSEAGAPGGVDLEPIFGASGWVCTNATAQADIKSYGFVPIPTCGTTS